MPEGSFLCLVIGPWGWEKKGAWCMSGLCSWKMFVSKDMLALPSSLPNSPGSLRALVDQGFVIKSMGFLEYQTEKELFKLPKRSASQIMTAPDSMFSGALSGSFLSSYKWWNFQNFLWKFISAPFSNKHSTVHFQIKNLPLFSSSHYSQWYLCVPQKLLFHP